MKQEISGEWSGRTFQHYITVATIPAQQQLLAQSPSRGPQVTLIRQTRVNC